MAPKYRITTRQNDPNNTMMQAVQDISPGDKILSEVFIAELDVSLASTHNTTDFLNPDVPDRNGRKDLQRMRNKLSAEDRTKLDNLFNMDPANGILTLAATNAFTEEEMRNGYKRMVLRIYDEISRVNHSCVPNAAMSWSRKAQKAYLRALRDIPQGTEITICYYAKPELNFKIRDERRQDLRDGYHFDCACEVCGLNNKKSSQNDRRRTNALTMFQQLDQQEEDFNNCKDATTAKEADLKLVVKYITLLKQLSVADDKLAWAYEREAMFHHQMYDLAREAVAELAPTKFHCTECKEQNGIRHHLDSAWDAIGEAHSINVRIHGEKHP